MTMLRLPERSEIQVSVKPQIGDGASRQPLPGDSLLGEFANRVPHRGALTKDPLLSSVPLLIEAVDKRLFPQDFVCKPTARSFAERIGVRVLLLGLHLRSFRTFQK